MLFLRVWTCAHGRPWNVRSFHFTDIRTTSKYESRPSLCLSPVRTLSLLRTGLRKLTGAHTWSYTHVCVLLTCPGAASSEEQILHISSSFVKGGALFHMSRSCVSPLFFAISLIKFFAQFFVPSLSMPINPAEPSNTHTHLFCGDMMQKSFNETSGAPPCQSSRPPWLYTCACVQLLSDKFAINYALTMIDFIRTHTCPSFSPLHMHAQRRNLRTANVSD